MELSWISRLRLALAVAIGIVVFTVVAHPLTAAYDSYSPITLFQQRINVQSILILTGLAFAAGFLAYFLAWPYGREMGMAAVPAGLAAFGIPCGTVASLIQMNPDVAGRTALYGTFRYEGFLWLAVIAAGIVGVFAASRIAAPSSRPATAVDPADTPITRDPKSLGNVLLGLVTASVIAFFATAIFVKGIITPTATGNLTAQPAFVQIAFGLLIAFGLAGFAVKLLFGLGWMVPLAAVAIVNFAAATLAANRTLVEQMAKDLPASTFALSPFAILPVQLVAFGAAGAILGYWLAVRYNIWRKQVSVV